MDCIKVNFCAAPSSRKSTICSRIESDLKQMRINADTSKEYSRQYYQNYGVPTEFWEEAIIFENQDSRDKGIAAVSEVMLSDAPCVNQYIFAKRAMQAKLKAEGRTEMKPSEYKFLEELHTKVLKKINWYDIIVVLPPNDPVTRDGTRTETDEEKIAIHNAIIGFLNAENIRYFLIDGDMDSKISTIKKLILVERDVRMGAVHDPNQMTMEDLGVTVG